MRLAIITLHREVNYGSALQAFAFNDALLADGHEAEIVDYTRPSHTGLRGLLGLYGSEKGMPHRRVWGAIQRNLESRRAWSRAFQHFFTTRMTTTARRYRHLNELRRNPPMADAYITGSDQLWNSDYNRGIERAFFLDFGPAELARIAFATSFGNDDLSHHDKDTTRALLQRYSALGIREPAGCAIVQRLGLDATVVLDPTLLISAARWREIASAGPAEQYYVLVYCVEEDRYAAAVCKARDVADRLGCDVWEVRARSALRADPRVDRVWSYASPETFLRLMSNAAFIVTSSFHGTVFALIFEREFLSIAPPKYGNRAETLLASVGLSDRFISADQNISEVSPIDWPRSREALDQLRADSVSFLRRSLESVGAGSTDTRLTPGS